MNRVTTQRGYIIAISMVIIAIAVTLVTYIYRRVSVYIPVAHTTVQKEKASLLALSGLQIACGSLAYTPEQKENAEKNKDSVQKKKMSLSGNNEKQQQWLMKILPTINRSQQFKLTQEQDGVDATISITISCEQGKININQIYDFQKHAFRPIKQLNSDWGIMIQQLCTVLEKNLNTKELFPALKKMLDRRNDPLNDITELLEIKEFSGFKNALFYEPPQQVISTENEQRPLFLSDIFTLYSDSHLVNPWVFSDSLCGILGLPRVQAGDLAEHTKIIGSVLKNFKTTYTWKTDWKQFLVPIYQKELQSLPKGIESVLQTHMNLTIFSISVAATYGRVTQRLFALVERKKKDDKDSPGYKIVIRKMYKV